ncbi:MAG: hypothetical protein HYX25_05830 [Candidatus Solibacter usitatus]|nr:hypothetical protein [Candidatus Solibacter usitatus]
MPLDPSLDIVARWNGGDPQHAALLREAGVTAVLLQENAASLRDACRNAGIQTPPVGAIHFLALRDLDTAGPRSAVALSDGLWPGIARGPNTTSDETASPSREPWVDSNGYWIAYLRALYPDRAPLLGYEPDLKDRLVPFDSLELALIEAWVAGGNYVLTVEPRYLRALLGGDPAARQAWNQLGRTTRWLREHAALFRGRATMPTITALVEKGAATAEIANLLSRRNASPALAPAADPPSPDSRRLALVAANLAPPPAAIRARILAHAEAGSSVILAGRSWWSELLPKPARSEADRDYHALGRGRVIAYRKPVADPSEFALDVIDIVTHKRRAMRIWNAPAAIAFATDAPPGKGKALLHVINYGSPIDSESELQARIQGHFAKPLCCVRKPRHSRSSPPAAAQPPKSSSRSSLAWEWWFSSKLAA